MRLVHAHLRLQGQRGGSKVKEGQILYREEDWYEWQHWKVVLAVAFLVGRQESKMVNADKAPQSH